MCTHRSNTFRLFDGSRAIRKPNEIRVTFPIFELCRSVRVDIDLPRQVRRQGPTKKNADFIDTIRIRHEMGSELPGFVARDIAGLPPVSANCFDVSSLPRDMET